MSICVSVKVPEGLVLAADSAAAVAGELTDVSGAKQTGVLKTYDTVRKVSHVKDYPMGTLSWGSAQVANRTVFSLIKEHEHTLPVMGDDGKTPTVEEVAQGLLKHIQASGGDTAGPLGILVSGYSPGQFFPEQYLIQVPQQPGLQAISPDVAGQPVFGSSWFGLTDAIVRLHWGRDDQVLGIIANRFGVTVDEVQALLAPLQCPVNFAAMPLQDAIDYAAYIVTAEIGRYRFALGAPLCGGPIDIAAITPESFTWVKRKKLRPSDSLLD